MLDFKPGQKVVYPNYGVTVVETAKNRFGYRGEAA